MNADQLLAHYEKIADAPDAIARLRRFILDLAVRGKLVEQDPADERASKLLERIAAEKARLAEAGEIRKPKLLPEFEELPYALPPSWCWTRMRQVTSDRGQAVPGAPFTYIDVTAIDKENGFVSDPKVLQANEAPSRARKIVRQGDVIYSCVRPYLLNVAIVDADFDPAPIASTAFAILNGHGLVLPRYLWIVLRSPFMVECVEEDMRGQAYPAINDSDFSVLPFPLPPLAEQHRIVAKVDELMALCDQLEAARAEREATRDRLAAASLARLQAPDPDPAAFQNYATFALDNLAPLTTRPDQIKALRQTILNLAVRGKLVGQNPADEPASELLKRLAVKRSTERRRKSNFEPISEQEQMLALPPGWAWARFGEVFSIRTGFAFKSSTYSDQGLLVFRVVNFNRDGSFDLNDTKFFPKAQLDDKIKGFLLEEDEILMVMVGGTIGKTTRVTQEILPALLNQNMWRIRSYGRTLDNDYEYLLIRTINQVVENLTASTHGHFAMSDYEQKPIPLPPLAEQHRIVAKVDALMALCDRLEAALAAVDITRARLLEALLHEALMPGAGDREAA